MLTAIRLSGERDHTIASKEAVLARPSIPERYHTVVASWRTNC